MPFPLFQNESWCTTFSYDNESCLHVCFLANQSFPGKRQLSPVPELSLPRASHRVEPRRRERLSVRAPGFNFYFARERESSGTGTKTRSEMAFGISARNDEWKKWRANSLVFVSFAVFSRCCESRLETSPAERLEPLLLNALSSPVATTKE